MTALLLVSPALAAQQCAYRQPPLSPDMVKAQALLKQDNPFAALFALRAITQKEPKNALAWQWRADAEQKAGDTTAALEAMNHTIDLNPCDDTGYLQRAQIEIKAELNQKAYDDLKLVIDHDPKNAEAHELRGDILLNAAQVIPALADFDAALALGPPNVDLLLNHSGVLQELGRYKQAISSYDRALEIDPDNIDAKAARGYSRFFIEDYAGAAEDLRPVAEVNDNALAWLFLAESRLGQASAADNFAKEAAQRPKESWIHAVADHFQSDKPDDDLLSLLKDPLMRCNALFFLGEIALAHKDTQHAKALMLTATDACPIDPQQYSGSLREYVGAVEELKRLP